MKCDDMFSDPELDYIFLHFSVTNLVYILFLIVCGNHPLTSKRVRCRNLLYFDSQLNQIEPSTNIISRPMQSGDTGQNSKYYLEKYFENSTE